LHVTAWETNKQVLNNRIQDSIHCKFLIAANMQKIWNYVSNLGITGSADKQERRTIVLTNQLNLIMFYTMFLLLLTVIVTNLLTDGIISYGTLRVANLLVVTTLNLVLARYGFNFLSRLSLIFLPPLVFILGPTIMLGYVEEESYTYYPYLLICVSIVPQLLLHAKKEKLLLWFSLVYYFVLTLFIDRIMIHYGKTSFPIVDRIDTFYPFYKIAQVGLFFFINASIYYLRMLNSRFEEELNAKNKELDRQNLELLIRKDEIERQKDELVVKEISTWQKLVKIISHEIVNSAIPITNLAGLSSQMLEDETGAVLKPEKIGNDVAEDIHQSLKIIESRTKGLINFVKATKSLTSIPKPIIRKILVIDLFERIAVLFGPRFRETGTNFTKNVNPPDLCIEADLELIEQVIINLIKNSLEAMQDTSGPGIILNAGMNESSHVEITVSDNGTGINENELERLFLPFYSTKSKNSGIGLSLSQQIMMLHNGRLEISTPILGGATFVMTF
jgi:signal transduction histidine kinase